MQQQSENRGKNQKKQSYQTNPTHLVHIDREGGVKRLNFTLSTYSPIEIAGRTYARAKRLRG